MITKIRYSILKMMDPEMDVLVNEVDGLLLEANDLVLKYSDVIVPPAQIEGIRNAALRIGTALRQRQCFSSCTPEKQAEIVICRRKISDVLLQLTQCSSKKLPGKFFSVFAIC